MGEEEDKPCHTSIPLVSRFDRLDSLMKYIEGKKKLTRWGSSRVERQCKPLDMAVREAHSKGSLLDRVASLEDRLLQLCLEIESSHVSHATVQKSWGLASGYGSKRELSCSLPTFKNPNPTHKQQQQHHFCAQTNRFEFQRKPQRLQQRLKQPSSVKQKQQQHGDKDDKNCKSGKKEGVPPNWPHLRILGC